MRLTGFVAFDAEAERAVVVSAAPNCAFSAAHVCDLVAVAALPHSGWFGSTIASGERLLHLSLRCVVVGVIDRDGIH